MCEKKKKDNEEKIMEGEELERNETEETEKEKAVQQTMEDTVSEQSLGEKKPQKGDTNIEEQEKKADKEELSPQERILMLEAQLLSLTKEREEFKDKMLRIAADYDNFKKRVKKDMEMVQWKAQEEILRDFLPVFDTLEQALTLCEEWEKKKEGSIEPIIQGIRMVFKQFDETMAKHGLKRFSAVGQVFDPLFHEAIGYEASEEIPAGVVISEYRKGYMLAERLLRPSLVVVSRGKIEDKKGESSNEGEPQKEDQDKFEEK